MSVASEEKKFVIKHTFKDFKTSGLMRHYRGPEEKHCGVPWRIHIATNYPYAFFYLDCLESPEKSAWKVQTTINGHYSKKGGHVIMTAIKCVQDKVSNLQNFFKYEELSSLADGNLTVELEVKIDQISGFKLQKMRSFDDDVAKEFSDVTLFVKHRKFYVYKGYLASHSSYFKSLFSGNFSESHKSEIELNDIDPDDFQNFLELIYGETSVEAHSVLGILQLADFFDSKAAIRRCEEFLVDKSELPLNVKFHAATKYKLEKLKEKCLSEIETTADISSIIPEDPSQFDYSLWKKLLMKSNSMSK